MGGGALFIMLVLYDKPLLRKDVGTRWLDYGNGIGGQDQLIITMIQGDVK